MQFAENENRAATQGLRHLEKADQVLKRWQQEKKKETERQARRKELSKGAGRRFLSKKASRNFIFLTDCWAFPPASGLCSLRSRPGTATNRLFMFCVPLTMRVSFPLIHPHLILPSYRLAPAREVFTYLKADCLKDLFALVIATLRGRAEDITVNLAGPVLVNPTTRLGLQIVVDNYPVRFPLVESLPS